MFDRLSLARGKQQGASLAMSWLEDEATYARFEVDVAKVSAALLSLRELGLSLVAVRYQNAYKHWVLLLSLARLGIASASLPNDVDVNFQRDLKILSPDLLLLDEELADNNFKSLVLSEEWFENIFLKEEQFSGNISVNPDKVMRVCVARGTHREPHLIALSARYIETAVYHLLFQDTLFKDAGSVMPRVVPTIGFETASGFLVIVAALTSGTSVHVVTGAQLGAVFSQKIPTVAVVSPAQAEVILQKLPPGMEPLTDLYLSFVGGRLSRTLYDATVQSLTPHVQVIYGTDECGMITALQADSSYEARSVGTALPWVGLEVVDDAGAIASPGQIGRIRVSGTGVVEGYYNNPKATEQQFREGWFYPGDLGFLTPEGMLFLAGRTDDLVSLGGNKFDLSALDERLKTFEDVHDAASFVVSSDQSGGKRENVPWVALQVDPNFSLQDLAAWVRGEFPLLPEMQVVIVDVVPKGPDGQADRALLAQSVSEMQA